MRATYILVMVCAVTFQASSSALPPAKTLNSLVEKKTPSDITVSAHVGDVRLLRADDKEEEIEEERGLGGALVDGVKKLNPITAAKKAKEKAEKIKQHVKELGKYEDWLEEVREAIDKD
ncbi:avr2 family secreted RxLR effector peptide protein, putative [Phytophthora infestans T30-4]|uniref:RxLR effector protein n=2 Tax=Phytophthora infestans TaxID=4787 RepID=D0N8I5_PHYIT|nr:avr2 family secreted RxLR effector peptide protein, putative [Phytophthora infestans T30-4]EEY53870.1 avr2 family secreted RxLR effector peptide protein, putative [Phytophthora infestans T30-4]KAF4033588.1 RXLR domain-containing protein [Phytophthora infestans]|eukprot:XP_002904501.1 avr2 family secreted RxLR effector peptide protein, putative [Phytophthora infestans T30-4]